MKVAIIADLFQVPRYVKSAEPNSPNGFCRSWNSRPMTEAMVRVDQLWWTDVLGLGIIFAKGSKTPFYYRDRRDRRRCRAGKGARSAELVP